MSRPRLVAKFGGSILRDAADYDRVASKVEDLLSEWELVVVVSAMKGVTNELLSLVREPRNLEERISHLAARHIEVLEKLVSDTRVFGEAFSAVNRMVDELAKVLWALRVIGEATPRLVDYVLSFGERLSAKLLEAVLRSRGVPAVALTGWEAGIVTDEKYGEATPIMEETTPRVRERIGRLLEEGRVPVVTGFIAATREGSITTLGRGGSDYTASLIASIIGAEEVRFYTDVPGVLTADPRRVPGARTVPRLCVYEALELARAGGKKFHPRTFEPLLRGGPRAVITDLEERASTVVERECRPGPKCIALVEGLAAVDVEGGFMAGRVGTAAMVTSAAREAGVNIAAIAQPVTETRISVMVEEEQATRLAEALEEVLRGQGLPLRVAVRRGLAALVVVGYGASNPEVQVRLLEAARDAGARVYSTSVGIADAGVMLVIDAASAVEAARLAHERVVLPALEEDAE